MRRRPASSKLDRRASTFWVTRSGRIVTRRMAGGIWGQARRRKRWHASRKRWGNFSYPATQGPGRSYGTRVAAYGAVDNYVYESVRHFLRRRHQVPSRGTNRFSINAVFGELRVL